MRQIQIASPSDKEGMKALWQICFGDSKAFTDWFFTHRFAPFYSVCVKEAGRIIGAMQSFPLHISIRGVTLPAAIVAGVSIHPDFRGQGLMHDMFSFYMNEMRSRGVLVVPHTPSKLNTFFSIGHFPVTDCAYATLSEEIPPFGRPSPYVDDFDLANCGDALFPCYQAFWGRYSCMIDRSLGDFYLKMADYRADGAKCLAFRHGEDVLGYLIYYAPKNSLFVEECTPLAPAIQSDLLKALHHKWPGRKINAKLSPYIPLSLPDYSVEVRPKSVMGAVRIDALLQAVVGSGGDNLHVELNDPVVAQNNGCFTLSGKPSSQKADITMACGRLVQLICGYYSIFDLVEKGWALVSHADLCEQIDRLLPKMNCFIFDEY